MEQYNQAYTLPLSQIYIDFLNNKAKKEFMEGTTAAGKTTIGAIKFMLMVAESDKKYHMIAAADIGTAEKNIINAERGILDVFGNLVDYKGSGDANIKLAHIKYATPKGLKIIYVVGYSDKRRWEKALGGQLGCLYIDEINIGDMEFVRESAHRCEYELTSSNPDDPNLDVYKEYINRSRPLEKYRDRYPAELLEQLNEPAVENWVHWYFTFDDNLGLTEEQKQDKINALAPGTKIYKNKILGLRGKSTGLAFNYDKKNIISKAEAKKFTFKKFNVGVDTSYSKKTHDKLTFVLIGITTNKKCVVLKTRSFNNKDRAVPFAPSDVIPMLLVFLEECKEEWGFVRTVFIDNADAATIAEAQKSKRLNGLIYEFLGSWKKLTNITRVQLQQAWLHSLDFLVVNECKDYIAEMNVYGFDEDGKLEDANDHSIQGGQYAWIPYRKEIGNWEVIREIIKGADED